MYVLHACILFYLFCEMHIKTFEHSDTADGWVFSTAHASYNTVPNILKTEHPTYCMSKTIQPIIYTCTSCRRIWKI